MGKFSDLPAEIVIEIFTRLPTESVLDCKSVSKSWRNVLHNQSFYQTHSELLLSKPDSGKFRFIFKVSEELYYLEYDDEIYSHRVKKLIMNPPFEIYVLLGSCNGLICINGIKDDCSDSCVAYICNPITRECITLPELDRSTYYDMLYGFGYIAATKEYKVVRLYTLGKEDKFGQVEVYTLGTGKGWRNAGKISFDSGSIGREHAVFVNGLLYWDFGYGKTMVFDLADEVVVGYSEFPTGTFLRGVLGGYLCGTVYRKNWMNSLQTGGYLSDIWLWKKKEDESFSWSKEFSLINTGPHIESLALTSSGAVLCHAGTKLFLYDLKSSSSTLLEDFGRKIYDAIPHMNTLVSLKALGEDITNILEDGATNFVNQIGAA